MTNFADRKAKKLAIAGSTGLISSSAASSPSASSEHWSADLRMLSNAGYTHVDLSDLWFPVSQLTPSSASQLSDALAHAGLEVVGASVIGVEIQFGERQHASMEWARAGLKGAALLGAPHVSLGLHPRPLERPVPGGRPGWVDAAGPTKHSNEQFELAARGLRELCDEASDLDIDLSLEMHESTLVDNSSNTLRLLELVDRERLGVNPDLGNLIRTSWKPHETWYQTMSALADRVTYWHIKNSVRIELPEGGAASVFSTLGTGLIDYRAAILLAIEGGYKGPLVVEHYGGDSIAFAADSYRYLRSVLDDL